MLFIFPKSDISFSVTEKFIPVELSAFEKCEYDETLEVWFIAGNITDITAHAIHY